MKTVAFLKAGEIAPDVLGVRIDALEAALRDFNPHNLDSLVALRRQIGFAGEEGREAGSGEIVAAAEQARAAGVLNTRKAVEMLIATMRDAARTRRPENRQPGVASGAGASLMSREAFALALRNFASGQVVQSAAVAVINVAGLPELRSRLGAKVAEALLSQVGGAVRRLLRAEDCVARFDNDDIAIYLPGEDSTGLSRALARIESTIRKQTFILPDGTAIHPEIKATGQSLDHDVAVAAIGAQTSLNVGLLSKSNVTAMTIESRLKREGFTVTPATDSSGFAGKRIDAVVVDVPAGQLMSLILATRKSLANKRVVFVVLVQSEEEGHSAMEHGASEYLCRPVDLDALVKTIRRFARRGAGSQKAETGATTGGMLVVSEDVYSLITISTALQKQAAYEVRLAKSSSAAADQIKRNPPSAVIVDLRLDRETAAEVLAAVAAMRPRPPVVMLVEEREKDRIADIAPAGTQTIIKPLKLLSLATDVKKLTGVAPSGDIAKSAATLQAEILRLMQLKAQ